MKRFLNLFVLILLVVILSACTQKKAHSTKEISDKLSNNGFIITDVTNQKEDSNINYVASANNGKFQIEYYVFVDVDNAKKAYESNKASFENNKTKGKEKEAETYQKYTQELSDTYNLIARIDNTLIYSSVNIEYKKVLNKVIKDLGY